MGEERDELRLRSGWHFLSVSSFVSEREGERESEHSCQEETVGHAYRTQL